MRMNGTMLVAAACALLAAPALAQSNAMKSAPQTTGAAPAGEAALSTQDFVDKAAVTNMFEVKAAKLAARKDQSKQDRTFARRMIKDHGKAEDQLARLVNSGAVQASLPKQVDPQHQQMLDKLGKLSGKRFDNTYDHIQKAGHKQAVAMFRNYAQNGSNPALRDWAKKTLPTLKEHLSMAQKLD